MAISRKAGEINEELRLLVDHVIDYAIFMLDATGHIATWNTGAQRINGYSADEIIGQHFSRFYPEADVLAGKCEHELTVATREGRFEEEGWRLRKDGSRFWASVVITPTRDRTGKLVGFAKVTRDLTARKQTEREREMFRLLVEGVVDYAIFMLDPTGHVTTWNAGAQRLKGYAPDEIIGEHFSRFYVDEDKRAGKCDQELEVVRRDGRIEVEGWRLAKDGTRFFANAVMTSVRDRDGELIGFSNVVRDLSARKQAEQNQMAFRLLVEGVVDYAIFMLDPSGRVATWNAGAQRIKGYAAREIIGQHFSRFYPEDDVRAGKCEYELLVAERDGRFEDEGWRVRKDGGRFWANVVITRVSDEEGKMLGFSKVTRDLTMRKRAEEERTARIAAEQASRAKDEFLAMLGHELRNPLAPIVTALQLMKLRGDSRSSKEQQIIERQATHMVRLVDDLLDVSRITRGNVELKKQPIDLRNVIARAIEVASPLLEQRLHHFDVDVLQEAIWVDADEARMIQVFANLLANAAKYTDPAGHIRVNIRGGGGEVIVEVRDDGVGISPELLPRVFDLFVQGEQGAERARGGLGIGLHLVRTLVTLHGGSVDVRSAGASRGSTFTVRLPTTAAPHPEAPRAELAAPPGAGRVRRVLLVDDNRDALAIMAETLTALGHDVRTAGDAAEALRVVRAFTPEVAILDIGLPGMDGYELASRLRAELGSAEPKLVALTGYGQRHDHDRSREAGFAAHLVKPVDIHRLSASIASDDFAR